MSKEYKQLLFQAVKSQLDHQMQSVDSFTTRAGLVLATCGVIFTGYLQLLSSQEWVYSCFVPLFILEIGAIVVAGFFAFFSLSPGSENERWRYDPDPEKLYRLVQQDADIDVKDEVIKSMIQSFKKNRDLYEKKYRYLRYSRYALCFSGSMFIFHLLIFILK